MKLQQQLDIIQDDQIQENIIQEIEPITTALVVGSVMALSHFILLIISTYDLIKSIKVNKQLSENVNKVLKSGNKWIVHVLEDKSIMAFSFGFGRHVFVSTELINLFTERELMAVLLHEVYHNTKKHTYKELMYKYPLFYLASFVAITTISTMGLMFAGILSLFLIIKGGGIFFNMTFGRNMEYKADSFAAKYGYGDDLISALKKIKAWVKEKTKYVQCGMWCKIMEKLDRIIDEHPTMKNRIQNILKQDKEIKNVAKTRSFGKIKNFALKAFRK